MHDNQRSHRRTRSGSRQGQGRRRGGSRDRNYSDGNSGSSNSSSGFSSGSSSRSHAPAKTGFWAKLVSLFTGKPKKSSRSTSSSRSEESRPSERQGGGHRRFESSAPAAAPGRQARKPELVEVSSPKIYVGNLSFDATESDLQELFNGVGKVQNAEIVSNKYTQKSKGFAFVTMLTVDEARRAVTELHDKDFMGRKLVVSGAKTSDIREGSSRSQETPEEDEAPVQQDTASASSVE